MHARKVSGRFGRCPNCRNHVYERPGVAIYNCSRCGIAIRAKNSDSAETDLPEALSSRASISSDEAAQLYSNSQAFSILDTDSERPPPFSSSPSYSAASRSDLEPGYLSEPEARTRFSSDLAASRISIPYLANRVEDLGIGVRRARQTPPSPLRNSSAAAAAPASDEDYGSAYDVQGEPVFMDPTIKRELLVVLDQVRRFVDGSSGGSGDLGRQQITPPAVHQRPVVTSGSGLQRSGSRLARRLETQSGSSLPANRSYDGSSSVGSPMNAGSGGRRAARHHCRPIIGGVPFIVCSGCLSLLRLPAAVSRRGLHQLKCGSCDHVMKLMFPLSASADPRNLTGRFGARRFSSSRLPEAGEGEPVPLHRVMGYESPSPLLQSQRF